MEHMDALTPQLSSLHNLPAERAMVERTLLWAFIAGLAWCPFWFGSNTLLAWGINALLFPGLVAVYELSLLIRGEGHPVAIREIKAPAALFAAVILWIVIQNATWTPNWLHHPIWQMTADALQRPVDGSISVNRELSTLALLRLMTAASVFWIAVQLCRDASRAFFLLKSIAALSCAYAAYGLFAFALMPGRVLWFGRPFPRSDFLTSTFINPNTFATFAGMGFIVICALVLRFYSNEFRSVGGSLRFRIAEFIAVTGRGAVLIAGAVLILVALLLSQSRAGTLSTFLGLFVLGTLTLTGRKHSFVERHASINAAVVSLIAILMIFTSLAVGDAIIGRLTHQGIQDNSRMAVYTIMVRSIFDAPLLGYGYGTFADVFPMFRDQSVGTFGRWEAAHNTYLEVFQGLGLVFGGMLVASLVLLALRCVKGAITRLQDGITPCVSAGVAFLLGAHSLVDFSVQIQAVGVTFMALLGAGVAQSKSSRLIVADQ